MRAFNFSVRFAAALLALLGAATARINVVDIVADSRDVFSIETFGAASGAQAILTLESFNLLPTFSSDKQYTIAFWAHLVSASPRGVCRPPAYWLPMATADNFRSWGHSND